MGYEKMERGEGAAEVICAGDKPLRDARTSESSKKSMRKGRSSGAR
jgi:hypothetical protein